jgi:tetratricopeptide (TPR) repeat protein
MSYLLGDDYGLAESYCNMAMGYERKKDFVRAVEFYNQSLQVMSSIYGEQHIDVSILLTNLGNALRASSQFEKALETYTKAYDITVGILGTNHPAAEEVKRKIDRVKMIIAEEEQNRNQPQSCCSLM